MYQVGVQETVYFQAPNSEAKSHATRFKRPAVNGEEGHYVRPFVKLGEEWRALDTGWLEEKVSVVVITNHETKFEAIPTPEQRAEALARVVEVGVSTGQRVLPCQLINPGESLRIHPIDVRQFMLRCRKGETRVTVTVFPN